MRISFNEKFFKGATLKEVKELYKGASKTVQIQAQNFWRKVNKKGV